MSRSLAFPLHKIVTSNWQASTFQTVQIKNIAGTVVAIAAETPANSGNYVATWNETSYLGDYGYWYLNGVQQTTSPFGRFYLGPEQQRAFDAIRATGANLAVSSSIEMSNGQSIGLNDSAKVHFRNLLGNDYSISVDTTLAPHKDLLIFDERRNTEIGRIDTETGDLTWSAKLVGKSKSTDYGATFEGMLVIREDETTQQACYEFNGEFVDPVIYIEHFGLPDSDSLRLGHSQDGTERDKLVLDTFSQGSNVWIRGPLLERNDNTIDWGATINGTFNFRPRDVYVGRQVISPGVRVTTAPTAGYVLTTDNAGNGSWQRPSINGASVYYLTNSGSVAPVTGYKEMTVTLPLDAVQTLSSGSMGVGTHQNLWQWISDPGFPGVINIPAGLWHLHIHARVSSGTKTAQLHFHPVWVSGSVPIQFNSSPDSVTLTSSFQEIDLYAPMNELPLLITDRIGARLMVDVSGPGSNVTIHIQVDGTDLALTNSRLDVPAPAVSVADFVPYSGAVKDLNLGSHNLEVDGGTLTLNNGTANQIKWGTNGVAAPTFTSYSAGVKALLYDNVDASHAGYYLGVENTFMDLVVDTTASGFKFYGGTTLAATVSGLGDFTAVRNLVAKDAYLSQSLHVSGSIHGSGALAMGGGATFGGAVALGANDLSAHNVTVNATLSLDGTVTTLAGDLVLNVAANHNCQIDTPNGKFWVTRDSDALEMFAVDNSTGECRMFGGLHTSGSIKIAGNATVLQKLGIGAAPTVQLDASFVDSTTSYIIGRFNGVASGYGAVLQFTDGNTYNVGFGTTNTSGDMVMWDGRFPGTAGTEIFRVARASGNGTFGGTVQGLEFYETQTVFTPTTIGWYRVYTGSNGDMGGRVVVRADLYDNALTDIEFHYNIGGFGTDGAIQQLRYSSYNLGVVDQVRISSDGGGTCYLDLHISTATTPQPVTVRFSSARTPGYGAPVSSPVVGAVVGSTSPHILVLGHGFRSTNDIIGSNSRLIGTMNLGTDPSINDQIFNIGAAHSVRAALSITQASTIAWRIGVNAVNDGTLRFDGSSSDFSTTTKFALDSSGNGTFAGNISAPGNTISAANLTATGTLSIDGTVTGTGGDFVYTIPTGHNFQIDVISGKLWLMRDSDSAEDWAVDSLTGEMRTLGGYHASGSIVAKHITGDGTTGNIGLTAQATSAQIGIELKRLVTNATTWQLYIPGSPSTDLRFFNGSDLATLTNAGALSLASTIKTAAGTTWDLGANTVAATVFNATHYLAVTVGGVAYKIALCT